MSIFDGADDNPIPQNTDFAMVQQMKGLMTEVQNLQSQVAGLSATTQAAVRSAVASSIINFLRNTDLNTSDFGRRGFTYTTPDDAHNVCAFWYAVASASAGPFVDSVTGTESADAIAYVIEVDNASITTGTKNLSTATAFFTAAMATKRCIVVGAGASGANLDTIIDTFTDSTHVILHDNAGTTVGPDGVARVSDAGKDTVWNSAAGYLEYGGALALVSPLQKNYCRPGVGNDIFVVFSCQLNTNINADPLTDDYQMRVSVWDNTAGQQKVIEGTPITIQATLDRGTGSVTRHYIVRYYNASGDTFLSSTSSPASVSGTPNPTAVDPGQVSVVFPMYPTVQSVQVFRSDNSTSLGDYYLIDTVSTGIDNVQDNGGRDQGPYAFPADDNWKADALIFSFGAQITNSWQPVSFHILTPATYDLNNTNANSQWLRLDILDSAGNIVAIPPMALLLDFFALGYRPGTWSVSADDQQAAGDFTSNAPPASGGIPTGGGSGGDPGDPGGGGSVGGRGILPF